jgi:hypothetical protein
MVEYGFIHIVKCKVFSLIDNKNKNVGCECVSQNMWAIGLL